MPGSCESEQNSSSANLISSLRKFRFQNKTKPTEFGNNSQANHNIEITASSSSKNTPSQQASCSSVTFKNHDLSKDSQKILQTISSKIQTLFKNTIKAPLVELKLTSEENKKLRDTVLKDAKTVQKWSSFVSEHAGSNPNETILKVKRLFLTHLARLLLDVINKTSPKSRETLKTPPVKTYSRTSVIAVNKKQVPVITPPQTSESNNQGAMDDYEEFCEKEQSLRKLLDAFPGADIMEAQDILVKCQWDLNKAIQEAQNQPLRTTRKRSFPGNFVAPLPGNMQNQRPITSPQQRLQNTNVPEEIVLDSSDDDEMNGTVSSVTPPVKRARRLISTDSSGDEVAPPTPAPPVQPLESTALKPKSQFSSVQQINSQITLQSSPISQGISSNPKNSPVDTSINIPQALSIKPVSISNNEKTNSTATMPNLPKGLCITKVGGVEPNYSSNEKTEVNGDNQNNSLLTNSIKSAQLVRIKPTNVISTNSTTVVSNAITVSKGVTISPVNQTLKLPPTSSGVSVNPVSSAFNVASSKTLSITPISEKTVVDTHSNENSSTEDESSTETDKKSEEHIKNLNSLKENQTNFEAVHSSNDNNQASVSGAKKKKSPGRPPKLDKVSKRTYEKQRRYVSDDEDDEDYGNEDIYDSDASDCEENLTAAHCAVLKFFQDATPEELSSIPGCSKKKVETIINLRPFTKWIDLVEKLRNDKNLSTDLLNGAKKVLDMRNAINKLMNKCQRISLDMEDLVEDLKENRESSSGYVGKQPDLLNERMHLTAYQMLGLNWLLLMHNQQVNAILADEMGLGKTVQAIAFLAYLKQIDILGPHLIVVPSSTLDNWKKEFETWWPSVSLLCYHGSQEARRELRMEILNDEVDEFDIMITTYNMVTSSAEDRSFFKRLDFHYVVFDEAHMLKNMSSQRYANLMRVKAPRRLLLTGTPLQNNLVELMSLLIFAMPHMFSGKIEQIKQMFSCVSKSADGNKNSYEKDRIDHAKQIMKPFVLRRLKKDVLKELPLKHDETRHCPMVPDQVEKYEELVKRFSAEVQVDSSEEKVSSGGMMMMQLRRAANHPLLLRRFFDDEKLLEMSQKMIKEPTHSESDPNIIFEDMAVMSDFELHRLCKQFKSIKSYALPDSAILNSGKFKVLDELIPDLIKEDHRILLFSQFTMVLDIIQEYMNIKKYKFLRLDGQTPVSERQQLIDEFNNDPEILVFLLSTRAGGLGINLTAADTVIIHDIDFNPYNDKQAEDRCHRVGQVRDVRVIRLISEKTIEEGILQRAKEKLKLERDIHDEGDSEDNDTASVVMLLRDALGLKPKS